ncbi:hypothetical protein TRIATDRAFT_254893 [Trichoderma atroviride IMI 206040]|uniref:Transmembrane protein n=1 Tax=Hypocrea atroviridis (strain ATCC 20476 / IMI 206040) TaxID=452589 RepID=G9NIN5_HYPAI|nr:uncharacterized protein TRIATDRAFT_297570 [Trichoderma atroviride IMI 206040]EHK49645.1 hypothetical protein TRIATDRAFT_254893 [Trichoderma atroviride IMI 206040]
MPNQRQWHEWAPSLARHSEASLADQTNSCSLACTVVSLFLARSFFLQSSFGIATDVFITWCTRLFFLLFPCIPTTGAERQEGRDPDMMHIRRRDEIERGAWDKRIFSFFSSSSVHFFRLREIAMRALTIITLLCFYFFCRWCAAI